MAPRVLFGIAKLAGNPAWRADHGEEMEAARSGNRHFPFGERSQRGWGIKLHRAEKGACGRKDVYEIVATIRDVEIALGIHVAVLCKRNGRIGSFIGGRGS